MLLPVCLPVFSGQYICSSRLFTGCCCCCCCCCCYLFVCFLWFFFFFFFFVDTISSYNLFIWIFCQHHFIFRSIFSSQHYLFFQYVYLDIHVNAISSADMFTYTFSSTLLPVCLPIFSSQHHFFFQFVNLDFLATVCLTIFYCQHHSLLALCLPTNLVSTVSSSSRGANPTR